MYNNIKQTTMRKNRFLSLLLGATMIVTAATLLTACHDDDNNQGSGGLAAIGFNYRTTLFGTGDTKEITLDSLTSIVSNVQSSASWLTATLLPDLNIYGKQVMSLKSTSDDGDEATITITAENGEKATITVQRGTITDGDAYNGANDNFITDWWNCKEVDLEGYPVAQYTPWNPSSSANIPNNIRFYQGDPIDGWEMAFCYLNDPHLEGVRYFALYNKWTGQVRLYTYIKNPTGWGSDITLNVLFGEEGEKDMYPLYNVHEYGIPTSHSTVEPKARLLSTQSQTFQTWISPFTLNQSLVPGWFCFEFDMSGYVPKDKDWLKLKTRRTPVFQVLAETRSESKVTLKGKLTGEISGTYTASQIIQEGGGNATAGILSALGTGMSSIGGFATSGISTGNAYVNLMTNNNVAASAQKALPVMFWGGFACNIVGAGLSLASTQIEDDPITTRIEPGKIDLTLDASMALDGYISEKTSNNLSPLSVSAEGVNSANSANGHDGHVGKGVWSLDEDPVVYIDKEDILSSESSFNLQCTSTGYSLSSFPDYNVRLVYAFDPTSVKLNINTDLFREIQDVTVTTNVGVFPNQPYGHTDPYRRMLMLGERPSFSLSGEQTSGTFTLTTNGSSAVVINRNQKESLADGEYEIVTGKEANCSVVAQKNSDGKEWQRFYGRLVDLPEINKQIMVDPQVFVPYTDGKNIGFPTAPDFVVRVDVQFTALDDKGQRKQFQFGKLYIPKIELVGWEDMCKVYSRLKDYSTKCEKNQTINTLANDSKVAVKHPNGHTLIAKTLRLLNRICE